GNQKRSADAGNNVTRVLPQDSVQLDGSGSSDPEGPVTYLWSPPVGVTLSSATAAKPMARLAGAAPGTYTVSLIVSDNGSPSLKDTSSVVISLHKAPKITSSNSGSAIVGSQFTYTPVATGFPKPAFGFNNRPAWLSWDSGAGVLRGTPTTAVNATIGLTAVNSAGKDSLTLVITVSEPPR